MRHLLGEGYGDSPIGLSRFRALLLAIENQKAARHIAATAIAGTAVFTTAVASSQIMLAGLDEGFSTTKEDSRLSADSAPIEDYAEAPDVADIIASPVPHSNDAPPVAGVQRPSDDHAHEGELDVVPVGQPRSFALRSPNGGPIEGYAAEQDQHGCEWIERPGVAAFRSMTLTKYPVTGDLGIRRACWDRGHSHHKEGRAWDWAVNVYDPAQKAQADEMIAWLLATDEAGNRHAMARRLGIRYIIWDRKIWVAGDPDAGFRPYYGPHPHDNHVHFSFDWAGALKVTSYWTGRVSGHMAPPVMPPKPPSPMPTPTDIPSPLPTPEPTIPPLPEPLPAPTPEPLPAPSIPTMSPAPPSPVRTLSLN